VVLHSEAMSLTLVTA